MLNNQKRVFLVRFQEFVIQEIFYPLILAKFCSKKFELYLPAPASCCGNCREEDKDTSSS